MHRQLHQSLRALCRQHCHRRLYSSQASAVRQSSKDTPKDQVAPSGSESVDVPENPHREVTSSDPSALASIPHNELQPLAPNTGVFRLKHSKIDSYLASLRAEGIEPVIDDLLRLAPKRNPSPKSPKYAEAHKELSDRLCRTFSKSQLQRFCGELNLGRKWSRAGRRKIEYAEAIMEKQWGWENLKELETQRKDASEVEVKTFPVSASELFLLLGKDGSELLQISSDYNVHISVKPHPLCIRIEGFRASIRKIEGLIMEKRKSIIEEKIELPTKEPLSPSVLQQVSRNANAFIENIGDDGKIRILSNSSQRLNVAKRLAHRAALQIKHGVETPFAALLPPPSSAFQVEVAPSSYALYPFVPQRALPWTSAVGSTFRSRKVSNWLGTTVGDVAVFSSSSQGPKGRLISVDGEPVTLEDLISTSLQDTTGSFLITASTGHVLVVADSSQHPSSILPPFKGRWQYSELLDWMKSDVAHRVFVPCLPPPLHSAPPTQEQIIHRLSYRRVRDKTSSSDNTTTAFRPDKVFHAEVIINRQKLEDSYTPDVEPEANSNFSDQELSAMDDLDGLFIDGFAQWDQQTGASNEVRPKPTESGTSGRLSIRFQESSAASKIQNTVTADDSTTETSEEVVEARIDSSDVELQDVPFEDRQEPPLKNVGEGESEAHSSNGPTCRRGRQLEFLVALPDRPMDLKITALGSLETVPIDGIPELQRYFETLRAYLDNTSSEPTPPEPPLFIEDGEERYILDLNASVRRSTEVLDLGRKVGQDLESSTLDDHLIHRISTTTESIYDLESGQKLINCELVCQGGPSGETWESFLRDVDDITALGFKAERTSSLSKSFSLDDHFPNEDQQLE